MSDELFSLAVLPPTLASVAYYTAGVPGVPAGTPATPYRVPVGLQVGLGAVAYSNRYGDLDGLPVLSGFATAASVTSLTATVAGLANGITHAPTAAALTGTELVGISQGGADHSLLISALATYVLASMVVSVAPVERPALAIYQRDTRTGSVFGRGAGQVSWVVGVSGAGAALSYRLRDATAAGNPVIVNPTQALAVTVSGNQTVAVQIPCGPYWYFIDWHAGSGVWVLGTQKFAVGEVLAIDGQSLADRLLADFVNIPIVSLGLTTPDLQSTFATWQDPGGLNGPDASAVVWAPSGDGVVVDSAFPGQLARRWLDASGVPVAIIGFAWGGTSITQWQSGQPCYLALRTVLAAAGTRAATMLWFQGHNDAASGMSSAAYAAYLTTLFGQLRADLPAFANTIVLVASIPNMTAHTFGTAPQIDAIRQGAIDYCTANPSLARHVTPLDVTLYGDGVHQYAPGNVVIADHIFRAMRGALGLDANGDAGPRLTGAATRAAGSTTIAIKVAQAGGANLVLVNDPATGLTAASQFQAFPAGQITGALGIASLTATDATTLSLVLSAAVADTVAIGLRYRMAPDASAAVAAAGIYDDNAADGLPHGRQLQMYVGEITVAAPGAGSSTGVTPGAVGSLAAGTPTSTTIPVTYSTPSVGTAPIGYAGQTSTDGTTWSSNAGAFGATGGALTGLVASTAYHLRVVASNATGASTTTLAGTVSTAAAASSGPSLPAVGATPVPPLFDIDVRQVSGASGASIASVADASGNGVNFVQATVAKQPVLELGTLGGQKALRFAHAAATEMATSSNGFLAGLNNSDITVLFVDSVIASNDFGVGWYFGSGDGGGIYSFEQFGNSADSYVGRSLAGTPTYTQPKVTIPFGTTRRAVLRYRASDGLMRLAINGVAEVSGTVAPDTSLAWVTAAIGSDWRNGHSENHVPEMRLGKHTVWSALATDAQRDALLSYANTVWSS